MLVSGYAGIGKSAVVNELHRPLVPPRGLFASGKFDQYKRDIPYATLAQAFQSLIRPLLSKNEEDLIKWRERLREALDPNGLLMVELVPELKYILADQPPVPELPPQDAQARFQLVFRRFIGVFARPGHPLALFLDDLQWLDAATRLKIFEGDAALESADAAAAAPEALLDDCVPRPRFAVDLLKLSDGVTGRIIEVLRRAAFQAIADKPQKVGPQQLQYVGARIPAVIGRRS